MIISLEPVVLSIVDGDQPGIVNGRYLHEIEGEVAPRIRAWLAEHHVDDTHPDRRVLVTPYGQDPGPLRNRVAVTVTAVSPSVLDGDSNPVVLDDLQDLNAAVAAARDVWILFAHRRAAALAAMVARDGLAATAASLGMSDGSLRTLLYKHGWSAPRIKALRVDPRRALTYADL